MFSPTLREALALRSAHKIPEALRKLEHACEEEKDPYACFILSRAYLHGGWGLNQNFAKYEIYQMDAENLGLKPTQDIEIVYSLDNGRLSYSLETAESLNDARYWYIFGYQNDKYRKYAYKRAAEQNNHAAMMKLIEFHGLNSIKAVKIAIHGQMYLHQEDILRFGSEFAHLIGREIYKNPMHPLKNSDTGRKAVNVYLNHIGRVKSEVFTWLLVSKCLMMPRDTRNLIALEIWRLRDDIRL